MENKMQQKVETRGRLTKCKICGHTFKILGEENRKIWLRENYVCPECNESYCILPETERQLRRLQDEYLVDRNEKVLIKMINIMSSYCRSLILKYFSNKITFEGQLEYYTNNVLSYTTEKILTKLDFKIYSSFAGYLMCEIRRSIFGKQEHLIDGESLDYMFVDGHYVYHEDTRPQLIETIEKEEERFATCTEYVSLIFDLEKACSDKVENYIRLLNVSLFLDGGEKAINRFFTYYDKKEKYITLKTLEVLKQELFSKLSR